MRNNEIIYTRTLGPAEESFLHQIDVFLRNGHATTFRELQVSKAREIGVCFLKPEVCEAGSQLCVRVFNELERRAQDFGVTISGLYGFCGRELVERGVLAENYIKVARYADTELLTSALSEPFTTAAETLFSAQVPVLGGLVLARAGFQPADLLLKWQDARRTLRVAEDCYVAPVKIDGDDVLLVNGFFPFHVHQYSNSAARILLAFIETDGSIEMLKSRFQGDANPDQRLPGSFRTFLSDELLSLGRPALTTTLNGFHLSGSAQDGRRETVVFQSLVQECGL